MFLYLVGVGSSAKLVIFVFVCCSTVWNGGGSMALRAHPLDQTIEAGPVVALLLYSVEDIGGDRCRPWCIVDHLIRSYCARTSDSNISFPVFLFLNCAPIAQLADSRPIRRRRSSRREAETP